MKDGNESESKSIIKRIWEKLFTREMITYIIVGVLTTVVNFISFDLLCNKLGMNDLVANVIAWFLAVAFAYVTNNLFVFQSGIEGKNKEVSKIIKFFGARAVTLGIEEIGLLIFVTWLNFNNLIIKAILAVFVIIVNYVFSKLYIFTKHKES